MPLWTPYDAKLSIEVADVNNVTSDGFAGSITAALFLKRFVERRMAWAHFDIFAWSPNDRPHCPVGGEAQGIRALERLLSKRYAAFMIRYQTDPTQSRRHSPPKRLAGHLPIE